ncbi:MAG: FHA domain-containing protein [Deltaproteobacteria bacterium]|nr:FHA domain-containing protein [Deltaproteobacteria bacterium]
MPKIILTEGTMSGRSFVFDENTVFIGRSFKNDIQISDTAISRKHLKIFRIGKRFFIEDLKSTNGTLINGESIASGESYEVGEGDNIQIGGTVIQLEDLPVIKALERKNHKPEVIGYNNDQNKDKQKERRSNAANDLNLVFNISELVKEKCGLNEFFERSLGHLLDFFQRIDRAAIFIFEKDKTGKKAIKNIIYLCREGNGKRKFSFSHRLIDQIMLKGKAVRMSDTNYEKQVDFAASTLILQIKSVVCVPIISASETLGAIYMDSLRSAYGFRKDDLMLLNSVSGYLAASLKKDGPTETSTK